MRWRGDGWLKGTRWVFSPNQGERPAGSEVSLIVLHNISLPPDDFSGNWVERFFLNRLDPAGASLFFDHRRASGFGPFPDSPRRTGDPVRRLRPARLARRPVGLAGAGKLQRLLGRDRTRGQRQPALHGSAVRGAMAADPETPGALSDRRTGRPLPCSPRAQDRPRVVFRLGRRACALSHPPVSGRNSRLDGRPPRPAGRCRWCRQNGCAFPARCCRSRAPAWRQRRPFPAGRGPA